MLTLIAILLLIIAWDKVLAVIGGIFAFLIVCMLTPFVLIMGGIEMLSEAMFGKSKKL